jgi:hypothetical protein
MDKWFQIKWKKFMWYWQQGPSMLKYTSQKDILWKLKNIIIWKEHQKVKDPFLKNYFETTWMYQMWLKEIFPSFRFSFFFPPTFNVGKSEGKPKEAIWLCKT